MVVYLEKMMERLNSGDYLSIFRTILCILDIGLMRSGRVSWQEVEDVEPEDCSPVDYPVSKQLSLRLFSIMDICVSSWSHFRYRIDEVNVIAKRPKNHKKSLRLQRHLCALWQ